MKQIPLTKIGVFNPGRLTDEEIEQSFITRIPFFEFLFKKIITEKPNSIPQNYLVIGQRGMGKTSLLVRIAAELRKNPYKNSFVPLSFPEEQYNIDRLSKFWLNCLDALADALDKENNKTELAALDKDISNLSKGDNSEANVIYEKFKTWTDTINRRPVLLVDNLNLIFPKINKEEQHQLRAILMSNGAPILVGASATSIEDIVDYGAPFYDAFQISYLKKLTFRESLDVLQNLAKITGNVNFASNLYKQQGRLEALYHLTGGTPRTLAILFPLIQNGFSESIQTDLDALLDIITPLYKARFEELAPQLQVVMDAVALHWDPINLEKLRTITQLENAQLSPQLKRLVDVGWLQKLDAYKAKGGAYELSERFFNVWYLMRRSSRRQKRELYCLTKFLETFYRNGIYEIAKKRMISKSESVNHIALDLALADALKSSKISNMLRIKSYKALIDMSFYDTAILKNFTIPNDITEEKVISLFEEANDHHHKEQYSDAEFTLQKLLKIDENNKKAWYNLGNLYQYNLEKYIEAEAAYKKFIKIDEKDPSTWNDLGNLYQYNLEKYIEAEAAYKKSIEIDEKDAFPWNGLGNLYQYDLKKYDEAEIAYKRAIEIDENDVNSWLNLGFLYQNYSKKHCEAEAAYKKSIEIDQNDDFAWYYLGNLYQYDLEKYDEAEAAYKKAIEIDENDSYLLHDLGNLYQEHLGKYADAEIAYKKAITIDEKDAYLWYDLGNLYHEHLGKYTEAETAYKKAIAIDKKEDSFWWQLGILYHEHLGKYTDAEEAYKKAIAIDKKTSFPWNSLGNLYGDLGKYTEAEAAYKKAIAINKKAAYSWNGLGNLYLEHLGKYSEAEVAYKKAIAIDEKEASPWNGLGNFYHDYLRNYNEAEAAYKKAIDLDPSDFCAKYNLVFLWRDKMNKIKDAKELFISIKISNEIRDSHYLNEALFAFYDKNIGIAETLIKKALSAIGATLPANTQDDWHRSAAIIIKLGYGRNLLDILSANGYDIVMRPFYVAIEALTKKEDELFLNSIAAEVREPGKKIMGKMKKYIN